MMDDVVAPRRYILLNERFAKKISEAELQGRTPKPAVESEVVLPRGTLLEEICHYGRSTSSATTASNQTGSLPCLRSLDHSGLCLVQCSKSDVRELDAVEADLLHPVAAIRDRIKIVADRDWVDKALAIVEGSTVLVDLGENYTLFEGKVHYRGPVPELDKGILFGVELLTHPERGVCDGSIRGKRYFHCNGNSGVFVSINCLELVSTPYKYRKDAPSLAPKPLSLEEACKDGTPPPPLKLGDRIVWISDNGPEYGEVKWLGKLLDVGNDWMVGVEFDNPIGSGTGNYNDHQLFEAKLNHASLVPIIGLMKAKDFLSTPPGTPPKPSRSRRKKAAEEIVLPPPTSERVGTRQPPPSSATTHHHHQPSSVATTMNHHHHHHHHNPCEPAPSSDKTKLPPLNNNLDSSAGRRCSASERIDAILQQLQQATLAANRNGEGSHHHHRGGLFPVMDGGGGAVVPLSPEKGAPPPVRYACDDDEDDDDDVVIGMICHPPPNKKAPVVSSSSAKVVATSREEGDGGCTLLPPNRTDLEVGSMVEVVVEGAPRYGVIRWIGIVPEEADGNRLIAGIEMEEEDAGYTDGTFGGKRYFHCPPKKAFFVRLSQCRKDSRFLETERRRSAVFGSIDCPSVHGDVPPLSTPEDLRLLCGKNRGIQGHHNSCYLDATLFAMFSCTSVFDALLHRPPGPDDIPEYTEVQRVLKEEIVNPLRANLYVRADRVMQLRTLLERLSSVRGLTCEEKDPEEFLNSLLNQILKADPFLKLSSNQESYFYQLFVEKDEKLSLPTVQQLFDQSFLTSDIKLREIPPCLLIQMPRFGKQFKMYPRIIPSQYLDITDVLEDSPRQCSVCGQVAEYECKECFGQFGEGLDSTAFCQKCIEKSHSHKKRLRHKATKLSIPAEFRALKDHTHVPRIYVELFAVVCIETSHYVCFVKCGTGPDAPWCFFDSMADRKGEQNGYNIPEVVSFPDLRWWLSEEGAAFLSSAKDDKVLPEIARRLLCDAYMCMYQSPDIMMYR